MEDCRPVLPFRLSGSLTALLVGAWLLSLALVMPSYLRTNYIDIDLEAFYCGGQVLAAHADPYLQQPLYSCESRIWHGARGGLIVPVPLPGVVIGALMPLSRLPYPAAKAFWLLLMTVALAWTTFLLTKLTGAWWPAIAAAITASATISLTLGQLVPFCLLGVVMAAFALRRNRPWLLACALALTAFQPQVYAATLLALLCWAPARMRIVGLATTLVLVIGSLAALGLESNLRYLTAVLPMHEYAELTNEEQFSLSAILYQWNIPATVALSVGAASYLASVIGGIVSARLLYARTGDSAYIVLAPAAFSVFLGTFVHLQLYAVALPLAIALAVRTRSRFLGVALVALAVPWQWLAITAMLVPVFVLEITMLSRTWCTRSIAIAAGTAIASVCVLLVAMFSYLHALHGPAPVFAYHADPKALAQVTWIIVERMYGSIGQSSGLRAMRLVSLGALAVVLTAAFTCFRPSAATTERMAT